MNDDILDSVLDLEDDSYQAGFDEGRADGLRIGSREAMIFGIETGYQKALEMGKLHGKALMLNACMVDPNPMPLGPTGSAPTPSGIGLPSDTHPDDSNTFPPMPKLPTIPTNERLKKHVETLLRLTDPSTVPLENTQAAVEEFDDRMRKAVAKAKVIDKLIAEPYNVTVSPPAAGDRSQASGSSGNIEELGNTAVRR
jgi:hypothetical protein